MRPHGVAVLGATGSVGTAALRVLERHADDFRVTAITAYDNAALLREQAERFQPRYTGIVKADHALSGWDTGARCLVEAAMRPDVDIVVNAVVGVAGLEATLAALGAGKRVALANKETLVHAGALVLQAMTDGGGEIVPIDSEHSAILQCIGTTPPDRVRRVILTASGGPFRGWSADRLARASVADALKHPTWRMGRKISVDSATLANKALEVIEAHFLFGLPYDRISVVVHPQSLVHSFVEFVDGSVMAQVGVPNMELPILYALTHPARLPDSGVPCFDPAAQPTMTFEPVAEGEFPALALGIAAGVHGGAAPAVFNAANEQAVALFLEGRISFTAIATRVAAALDQLKDLPGDTLAALIAADERARQHVLTDSVLAHSG